MNHYEVLGVARTSSKEEIQKAYKESVKKYHPDLQPKEKRNLAEEKMKLINGAYETLKDEEKRRVYDAAVLCEIEDYGFYSKGSEDSFYEEPKKDRKSKIKRIIGWVAAISLLFSLFSQYVVNMTVAPLEKTGQSIEQKEGKGKEKVYLENFNKTFYLVQNGFHKSAIIIKEYTEVWRKAIEKNENINTIVDKKYLELEELGILRELKKNKEQIEESMLLLQYPNEANKDRVTLLLDYYDLYLKQYSYAQNPRESYEEYITLVKQLEIERKKIEDKIKAEKVK